MVTGACPFFKSFMVELSSTLTGVRNCTREKASMLKLYSSDVTLASDDGEMYSSDVTLASDDGELYSSDVTLASDDGEILRKQTA